MKALWFLLLLTSAAYAQVSIRYDAGQEPVAYAVGRLQQVFSEKGQKLVPVTTTSSTALPAIWVVADKTIPVALRPHLPQKELEALQPEGFGYLWLNGRKTLVVLAGDAVGAQYGILELAEHLQGTGTYQTLAAKTENPHLIYRIVKFNLPWSPYRNSPATTLHTETCRDLRFWEAFLDMMAENRLNVLSLWNNHPFPYMIRATNFPAATPLNEQEMKDWQQFWKTLFRMAKQRGIQTFIVNWNIVVSPEFAKAYHAQEYNDRSDLVKRYTRESVTQLIDEYDDLTGIGVTLADWMGTFDGKMSPQEREDWIEKTVVAGMKAAKRPVKFLHRSVLAGDPMAMRGVIDRAGLTEPALVEIKFNWSHGHSTPNLAITHDYHSGKLDERFWTPKPANYQIQWMIRNEDFFILRWGQPDFIRQHIATNKQDYVNGYFIGSEGYIPAVDYSHKPSAAKTWRYAFEKHWLFYALWGRLLYNPATPDAVFAAAFDRRYGKGVGTPLLQAYKLASNMPLRLASFHRSTWDYTLYSEGFIEAEPSDAKGVFDRSSPFMSIHEFIHHETLDPQLLSIPAYVGLVNQKKTAPAGRLTPLDLADASEKDSQQALKLIASLRHRVNTGSGAFVSELDDAAVWSYLGLYLADKLRAGVALELYRTTGNTTLKAEAIQRLEAALGHWDQVIALTKDRYVPTPHVTTQNYGKEYTHFSWELMRPQVVRDIQLAQETTGN
ncbi:hypothetical protein GCM10023189_50910 [Nibrella saemangeumensis]|uniref:Glycosyl hydrolase family 20, domain 2 n=1 Tax=Nibrella saemangeumensis TaxID=1084526 RepID=A0ABP8NKX4_9BACT